MKFVLALVPVAAFASAARAATIDSIAFGSNLAGATASVEYFTVNGSIGVRSAIFAAIAPGVGQAVVPDPFGGAGTVVITVRGDTFDTGAWTVENFVDAFIGRVLFDLNGSNSLFDDSPINTDTPGSFAGRDSIVFDAGTAPLHLTAQESSPWTGQKNLGDLWLLEEITWPLPTFAGGPAFGPGEFYRFSDDTDIVPSPGTVAMVMASVLLIGRRRR